MYYREREGCLLWAVEVAFVAGVLLIFAILALRLVLGIVPYGFWGQW